MRSGWVARLAQDRRGATTIFTAGMAVSAMTALAFAVDLGALYAESRRLQGIADAAALSAAVNIGNAEGAARDAIAANGLTRPYTLSLETGVYRADAALAPAARFTASTGTKDAARVTVQTDAPLHFGLVALGRRSSTISRTATATRTNLAAFTIGSRLTSVNGGVANALLSGLAGSNVNLSAMDYDALAGAKVDLFAFADALRTETGLTAASFNQALAARITPARALGVLATALDSGGLGGAAGAVRKIVQAGVSGQATALNRLVDLGPIGAQDRAAAAGGQTIAVSAFDFARTMLEVAGGPRQVRLDLAATIPGLSSTTVYVAIGERPASSPWVAVTSSGTPVIRTAQTRVYIDTAVLPGVLSAVGVAAVRVPLYVELAEAQAKLASISCNRLAGTRAAALDVKPGLGHISIAAVDPAALNNFSGTPTESAATIARLLVLPLVEGQARVDLSSSDWRRVEFTTQEVSARTVKTVQSGGVIQGIATSLVNSINLRVLTLDLGGTIAGLTRVVLAPVGPLLDPLLDSVLDLLGLGLGEADVRIDGVRCGQAALVA